MSPRVSKVHLTFFKTLKLTSVSEELLNTWFYLWWQKLLLSQIFPDIFSIILTFVRVNWIRIERQSVNFDFHEIDFSWFSIDYKILAITKFVADENETCCSTATMLLYSLFMDVGETRSLFWEGHGKFRIKNCWLVDSRVAYK